LLIVAAVYLSRAQIIFRRFTLDMLEFAKL
jgi:hypothetical protein